MTDVSWTTWYTATMASRLPAEACDLYSLRWKMEELVSGQSGPEPEIRVSLDGPYVVSESP